MDNLQQNLGPNPPKARTEYHKVDFADHDEFIVDEYYWLRDETRSDPKVLEHIMQENQYVDDFYRSTLLDKLQEEIEKELIDLESRASQVYCAWKVGDYYYYKSYDNDEFALYRYSIKQNREQATKILSDAEVDGKDILFFEMSHNNEFIAFGFDKNGDEKHTFHIKNMSKNTILPAILNNVGSIELWYSILWSNDSSQLFYVTLDESNHGRKLYIHDMNQETTAQDKLIYEEKDSEFIISLTESNDHQYGFVVTASASSNEWWFWKKDTKYIMDGSLQCVKPRTQHMIYWVEHRNGYFYIGTNLNAVNFKIMQVPVKDVGNETCWRTVLAHHSTNFLFSMDCFKNFFVIYEVSNCSRNIRIVEAPLSVPEDQINFEDDRYYHYVEFPEKVYTFAPGNIDDNFLFIAREKSKSDYNGDLLTITYTSFLTPKTTLEYNMKTRTQKILNKQTVTGYDPTLYTTERLFAPSRDGTSLIPLSLVYKMSHSNDNKSFPRPLIMSGYGGYGGFKEPRFSLYRLSLLNRGVIYCIPHVRGGSELGKFWHLHGKLLHKKNSFYDLIDSAKFLIGNENLTLDSQLVDRGYTTRQQLAIRGRSAGGLLVAATAIMEPELFRTVVAEVPFVDVLVTMRDASIPWTSYEFDEWGNSNFKEYFDYMKGYCPIYNIHKRNYPHMMVTTGWNDPRVQFWEPAKFVAKLRAYKTDNNLLFLKTYMDGGHFARDRALMFSFILGTIHQHKEFFKPSNNQNEKEPQYENNSNVQTSTQQTNENDKKEEKHTPFNRCESSKPADFSSFGK